MSSTALLTLSKVKLLAEAGAIQHAEVVGVPGGWTLQFQVGMGRRMLRSTEGGPTPRLFKTTDAVFRTLEQAGIRRASVDLAGHTTESLF